MSGQQIDVTYDRTTSIEQFLSATAAKQPTPGGGSVAALAGALAASIGQMVLSYSIGKKDLAAHQAKLIEAAGELERARELLLGLMVEDQQAYETLTIIRKLPADSAEREKRLPSAVLACICVPQAIGAAGVAILDLCQRVVPIANVYLLSDLAVCAELAMATVRSAVYNCRVNLDDVHDPADRKSIEATMESLLGRAGTLIRLVIPQIWDRHQQSKKKP